MRLMELEGRTQDRLKACSHHAPKSVTLDRLKACSHNAPKSVKDDTENLARALQITSKLKSETIRENSDRQSKNLLVLLLGAVSKLFLHGNIQI